MLSRTGAVLLIITALIWGASYTFIKIAGGGLTPAQLVLSRLLLGGVALYAVLRLTGGRLPAFGRVWVHITVSAAVGMVGPFLLLAWGETRTSAAMAGVLIATTPLLTLAAAAVALDERATWRKAVGFLLGFVGVVVLIGPWAAEFGSFLGQLAVLGTATGYAAQAVYVRKIASQDGGIAPLASSTAQVLVAAVLQAAVIPLFVWHTPEFTRGVVVSILLLGILGTGLGYVLYFKLITDVGAASGSAVTYLEAVAAVLISMAVLREPITWNLIVGACLVLGALAFAENRLAMRRSGPTEHQPATPHPRP